jgi:adenylate kinase
MSQNCDRDAWIKGGELRSSLNVTIPEEPWRIVLLGAPGVGKGTQAELLCESLRACHLSTGDIFRAAKAGEVGELSPAMQASIGYMTRGDLVPDETVIDLVRERVASLKCPYGFLLDGFPRTVSQAEALDELMSANGLRLTAVLNYELPTDVIVERLSGRRTCYGCKTTFHLKTMPPKVEGICDKCGGKLYQRVDDEAESIRTRLQAYEDSTSPLTAYYRDRGLLVSVSAEGSPEEILNQAMEALWKKVDKR